MGADYSGTLGNWMVVETGSGERYQLGHLDDKRGEKMIGQTLGRGDVIGMEGTSGASTGYHLDRRLLEENDEDKRINRDPAAFYQRYLETVGAGLEPTAAREAVPVNNRVDVYHHGLDNVRVEGPEPAARQRAEDSLRDFGNAIRVPPNHHGAG
jgi:hypothetical protein